MPQVIRENTHRLDREAVISPPNYYFSGRNVNAGWFAIGTGGAVAFSNHVKNEWNIL